KNIPKRRNGFDFAERKMRIGGTQHGALCPLHILTRRITTKAATHAVRVKLCKVVGATSHANDAPT
ncbi:MAG TPA: hypothetical protein VFT58_06900, partial [Nitrososphaera sp.]|nr:hypothetical protein [Nitrososphaera sp.]